jgi:hypothetical protein
MRVQLLLPWWRSCLSATREDFADRAFPSEGVPRPDTPVHAPRPRCRCPLLQHLRPGTRAQRVVDVCRYSERLAEIQGHSYIHRRWRTRQRRNRWHVPATLIRGGPARPFASNCGARPCAHGWLQQVICEAVLLYSTARIVGGIRGARARSHCTDPSPSLKRPSSRAPSRQHGASVWAQSTCCRLRFSTRNAHD